MTRPSKHLRTAGLALTALIAMGAFWGPAFYQGGTGFGDWQWFHHMWEAGRIAMVRWGEPPLYNPYHCGGVPLWGNPQLQALAPTYWITALPFGTTLGHKLFILLHAVAGWMGAYALGRRELKLSPVAATYAAAVWCASGFFTSHVSGGHSTFLAFYYGPALLYAWRRAEEDVRWSSAVAAWMVLIVAEGGHYPFPYFVLWLGFDVLVRFASNPKRWKGLVRAAAVSGLLTGLAGAYRFVPILLAVTSHPNLVPDNDSLTPSEVLDILTIRTHGWTYEGHRWVWGEYQGYVGYDVLGLALIGFVIALAKKQRGMRLTDQRLWILAGVVLFFLFTQGAASAYHPWPLIQELPFYRSIHVPSRFRVLLTLYLAYLGGLAIDVFFEWCSRLKFWPDARVLAPWILVLGILGDLVATNEIAMNRWDGPAIGRLPRAEHYHLVAGGDYFQEYGTYPSANLGTTECYDPIPWERARSLRRGDVPQVEADAGRVLSEGRTSRTIWAEVDAEATRLVFNNNFIDGWVSPQGQVVEDDGRLAVVLARHGNQRVTLTYAPRDIVPVVSVTAFGWLALLLLPWSVSAWRQRRTRATSAKPSVMGGQG